MRLACLSSAALACSIDKPGLAELIVAKNRHGAVSNIQLTFRKELAQFCNYSALHAVPAAKEGQEDPFAAFSPK